MTDSLSNTLSDLWNELGRGVVDRRHGFHVPVLATVGVDGAPQARAVVLRRVLRDSCEIHCHTDLRSGKVAEIRADPRVAWHFYDEGRKLQLRIVAHAEVVSDGSRSDEAWARSAVTSRRCYLAPRAPGSVCDAPSPNLPEGVRDRRPTEEETLPGRANFALVVTRVTAIDWLFLASEGHQRARFSRDADGAWKGAWLEP
jgi:pyridoxine/pyridoxamine 5'-phosphate oxidase